MEKEEQSTTLDSNEWQTHESVMSEQHDIRDGMAMTQELRAEGGSEGGGRSEDSAEGNGRWAVEANEDGKGKELDEGKEEGEGSDKHEEREERREGSDEHKEEERKEEEGREDGDKYEGEERRGEERGGRRDYVGIICLFLSLFTYKFDVYNPNKECPNIRVSHIFYDCPLDIPKKVNTQFRYLVR